MHRRYREHDARVVMDLDGIWDFVFLGDVDPETVDVAAIRFDDRMAVPGCFDATPAYASRRGLVAYRREILMQDATPHRLWLSGVHHWCRVFLDGEHLQDHAGGFTRFAVDVRGREAGTAELVILVDNRFDYERSPLHHEYFDWYHFGGIARGAELHRLGSQWIDAVQVVTQSISPPEIKVTIAHDAVVIPGTLDLTLSVDGKTVFTEGVNLIASSGTIVRAVTLPDAALWSPASPNLHMLRVRLGDDDVRTRFGHTPGQCPRSADPHQR